ncbi:MAG: riboflavin biosynthesis protein RibF, partial [Elusimicrobiota bacterium]
MKRVITLGFFDGVHRGHNAILKNVLKVAGKNKMKPLAVTFERVGGAKDHSAGVLSPFEEKKRLIRAAGITDVINVRLTAKIKQMSADLFFKKFLLKKYNAGYVVVGDDFRFGRDKSGDVSLLSKLCKLHGVGFLSVKTLKQGRKKISSSKVRELVAKGRIEEANHLLGRRYSLTGRVMPGHGFGKHLGFPTANLSIVREKLLPRGVFSGTAVIGNNRYNSVINIGKRPTFGSSGALVPEMHLSGFSGTLLGKKITFYFSKK